MLPLPTPGIVWLGAKLMTPLPAINKPVSVGVPEPERYSRLSVPEGLVVLLAAGSAFQRNSCGTAAPVPLLNEEATQSAGLEAKPCVAVAVPIAGSAVPAAVIAPLNAAAVPLSRPVKLPVPPES